MFEKLIDRTLANLSKSNILVSAERCIRKRYHEAECVRCAEYCPVDCVAVGQASSSVAVDFEKCIECGVCVNACPTEVFTHKKLKNGKVMSRLKQYAETFQPPSPLMGGGQDGGAYKNAVLFACSMAREENEPLPPNSIVFPCLGFLTETHLVGVVSHGIGKVILDCTLCNECEFEKGIEIIKKTAASANKLLFAFGKDNMIETITEKGSWVMGHWSGKPCPLPPDGDGTSRREFFSQMKNSTYKMIADSIEDEETVTEEPLGNLPAFLPKRREILIKLLQRIRVGMDNPPLSPLKIRGDESGGNGFPFIQLSIDDKCNFCDMCSTFCPTGAIEKIKTVDDIAIVFNISKCVNCYPCYNLCPKNAMSCNDIMDTNKFLDDGREILISRGMTECSRCEMPFLFEGTTGQVLDFEGKGVCRRCEKLSRFEEGYLSRI